MSEPVVPALAAAPLEYEAASSRPYSVTIARRVRHAAIVPPAVGLAILLAFAVTGFEPLVEAGLWWLCGGGVLAFCIGVTSLVMYCLAYSDYHNSEPARREYGRATLICLAALPVAVGCVFFGMMLVHWWHTHLD